MPLNPPSSALTRSHLSSPLSLNPTPANIDDDMYAYPASVSAAQPAAPGADGSSSSSLPPPPPSPSPPPKLLLDSGASIHVVGDARLLSNLRDAPAGMRIRVADGNTLPVTKIGDIHMVTPAFTIPGVYLAPGLKSDIISVRQLTSKRICTWFDGDRAVLYAGPELVGEAVAPKENLSGLYVLQFLSVPNVPAAASSSGNNGLDMSVPKIPPAASSSGNNGLDMSVPKVPASSSGNNVLDMSMPKVPAAASSFGNNSLDMSGPKVPVATSSSGNNGLDNGEIKLVPIWCVSGSAHGSFGSVLCWMKALLRRRVFRGPREKRVSNRIQRKGKNSGRRR